MKTMTLQKQVLERIKTEHLKPTSKGFFKVRDYTTWIILGALIAALSLGFGMIIFMLHDTDGSVFDRLGLSITERLLDSVPVFWIVVTVIVAAAAYINFRRTKKGYRVSAKQFVVAAAIAALAIGSMIYAFDFTKYVDKAASANIPMYSAVEPLNTNTWFDPGRGLLSGAVKIKTSDDSFTLRDENFNLWTVTGNSVSLVPDGFTFQSGNHVKVIGKKTGDFQFQATEIRPFETPIVRQQRTQ